MDYQAKSKLRHYRWVLVLGFILLVFVVLSLTTSFLGPDKSSRITKEELREIQQSIEAERRDLLDEEMEEPPLEPPEEEPEKE